MPFGIRPSNVRVCHSTTRALLVRASKLSAARTGWQVTFQFLLMLETTEYAFADLAARNEIQAI
jgi:hypothetical protein